MELEQRVETLEHEMDTLKSDIRRVLLTVQDELSREPISAPGWRRRAWVLALLNMLVATTLFINIHFCSSDNIPFEISSTWMLLLRASWVAMAFLWLILQMYPLALLLEQESQGLWVILSKAIVLFIDRPGLTFLLILLVLAVAGISALLPVLWFLPVLVIFLFVSGMAVRCLLEKGIKARTVSYTHLRAHET